MSEHGAGSAAASGAVTAPVLLQICANDAPPFADICRYHAACAARLGWRPVTVMLAGRAARAEPDFLYLDAPLAEGETSAAGTRLNAALDERVGTSPIALTLCHRYRAYRAALHSARAIEPLVAVAHEFGLLRRRQRRLQRHWDRLLGRPRVTFAGISEPVRRELVAAAGRATLLPNGIDLARADAGRLTRREARARLGLGDEFVIAVVGRLHRKKCPELALAGFRLAQADLTGARLVFVGDGDRRAALEAAAGDAAVTFTGFVDDAPRCMAAFDLLLLPSGDQEAFGMVAVEAMAAGVPVLCGAAPGPRYVVGGAGLLVDGQDPAALAGALRLAHEQHRAGTLSAVGARGRQRVDAEFSVPAGARRLARLAPGLSGTGSAPPVDGS